MSLLHIKFDELNAESINSLISDGIPESRYIEYKQDIGSGDSAKGKYLKGITGMCNADGGDFILGIAAKDGLPKEISGIKEESDDYILKLEGWIKGQIDPQLAPSRYQIKSIDADKGTVIITRVGSSHVKPHRVKTNKEYYKRGSAGTSPMDAMELRQEILLSGSLPEKARRFVKQRIDYYLDSNNKNVGTSLAFNRGNLKGVILFHLIPLVTFEETRFNSDVFNKHSSGQYFPISGGYEQRFFNLDGYVFGNRPSTSQISYIQLFRSGALEAFDTHILSLANREKSVIQPERFIKHLGAAIHKYINRFIDLGVPGPYILFLNFLGAFGTEMEQVTGVLNKQVFDRDLVYLPDIIIEPSTYHYTQTKPLFDLVWQAFDQESCDIYEDCMISQFDSLKEELNV